VALRPLEAIDGLTLPDDAYLSLSLARNIAQGHGPQYAGQYTNGFQPLYVWLMVPVYWIAGQDNVAPVHLALLLMCLFDTLTLFLLFRLVRRLCTFSFTPVLTALLWILHPRIIGVATNGLETALACFFVTWALSYFQNHFAKADHPPTVKECVGLGGLLGLGMLARIDSILLAVVVTVALLWIHRPARRKALDFALLVNASTFLTYLPWLVYSFAYTGDFYPVSGSAVRLMTLSRVDSTTTFASLYGTMAQTALRAVAAPNATLVYWLAVLLALVLAFRHRLAKPCDGQTTILAVGWGYAAMLMCAYVFYIFGPHYFDRYLHPVRIPLLLTLALLIDASFLLLRRPSIRAGAAIVFAGMAIVPPCGDAYFKDLLFGKPNQNLGYMNLGLWARSTFPAGTVIGGSQTGAVGYFADNLKVVNLDGVVNKRCYESLVRRENLQYVREEGVRYLFGWKVNFAFLARMSKDFKPGDIEDVRPILGFRSWNTDWYVGRVRYQASEGEPAKK
jgi:hypothetical protein